MNQTEPFMQWSESILLIYCKAHSHSIEAKAKIFFDARRLFFDICLLVLWSLTCLLPLSLVVNRPLVCPMTLYYRPQRNCAKVMFSQACARILSTGGLPDRDPLDKDPLRQRPPPRQRPSSWTETLVLDRDPPPGQRPSSWTETLLLDRDPPGQRPPGQRHPPGKRPPRQKPPWQWPPWQRHPHTVTSGWYASYWNAFLFLIPLPV